VKRIVVCFTLLSVLLVACQLAGTPSVVTPTPPAARPSPARGYCGDGSCDGPENPQNRPADCEAGEQAIDFSTIIEGEVRCVDGETGAEFLQPAERLRVAEVPIVCRRAGSETVDLRGAQVELWTLEELGPAELVRQVAAAGANLIILRVFDYEDEPNPGVYFRTEHAPVKEDLLSALLAQARPAGLRVFAWMTTLNLPWVLQEHPDWAIVGYDWDKEQYTLAMGWYRRVSPFVPEFIDYLKGLYQDLARYDLDGIMFQDDLYLGDNEDFNYYAASAYFERFGRWPRIERFYDDKGNPTAEGEEWIKWKAERLMEVAREIMEAVRSINPGMEFGLDAYWETVLEPENGRKWFSQDARLALESKFDYLIVMSYHRSLAKEDGLTIEQALDLLGLMTKSLSEKSL